MKKTGKRLRLENKNQNLYNPNDSVNSGEKFLTVNELAERWRLHRNTILNYVNKGLLPYFRSMGGRIILIPLDTVEDYEKSQMKDRKEVTRKHRKKRKVLSAQNKKWRAE
jgi:excisionase family DNA binding protein